MAENAYQSQARLAVLAQLRKTTVAVYLDPPPSNATLRAWFDAAGIPRFKANPGARRGGGQVWYSVPAVEKFLRSRTLTHRPPLVAVVPSPVVNS